MEIKKTSQVAFTEIREFSVEDPCYHNFSIAWTTEGTTDSLHSIVHPLQVKLAENGGSSMPDTYFRLSLKDTKVLHAILGEYIEAAQKVCSECDQPLSEGQICRYHDPELGPNYPDDIPF